MPRFLLALSFLFASLSFADSATCPPNYGYSGYLIPSQWQYVTTWKCGTETLQSPIHIDEPFVPEYNVPINVSYQTMPLTVKNSGHDFRVISTRTNTISVGEFELATLEQFHFHTPSEHTIGRGTQEPAEIHFVHEDEETEKIVVIAVLLRLERDDNPALQPIIDQLPINLCASKETTIELAPLLPKEITSYYRYTGSLTTPACDGDVTFFVLPTTLPISPRQRDALRAFGENFRPQQPRRDRPITFVSPRPRSAKK